MLLFSLFALPASAQNHPGVAADSEVRKTLSDFIQAFDNLDWEKFRLHLPTARLYSTRAAFRLGPTDAQNLNKHSAVSSNRFAPVERLALTWI